MTPPEPRPSLTGLALVLVAAVPTAALLALSRLVDGPGAVTFDDRVGLGGEPLPVPKIRTTTDGTVEGPPTRLGRFLNLTCADELPQLWLVADGRMALVGPRPLRPEHLDDWDPEMLAVMLSHRPGLVGRWVVLTGHGHEHRFRDMPRIETEWLANRTRAGDLLLLATAPLGLVRAVRGWLLDGVRD